MLGLANACGEYKLQILGLLISLHLAAWNFMIKGPGILSDRAILIDDL